MTDGPKPKTFTEMAHVHICKVNISMQLASVDRQVPVTIIFVIAYNYTMQIEKNATGAMQLP